jgi:hypothetical protein
MTTLDEIRARLAKAKDMVACLCLPQSDARSRDWIMSIPARPDHDPDLVIAAALDDVAFLLGEVERLRAAGLAAIESHRQTLDAYQDLCEERDRERERARQAERERDAFSEALSIALQYVPLQSDEPHRQAEINSIAALVKKATPSERESTP